MRVQATGSAGTCKTVRYLIMRSKRVWARILTSVLFRPLEDGDRQVLCLISKVFDACSCDAEEGTSSVTNQCKS